MATYKFKCSVCESPVSARAEYYKRYLGRYDCETAEELSKHYVCRECRRARGEFKAANPRKKVALDLHEYPKFNEVKGYLTTEAIKLQEIGLSNKTAIQNFAENVKIILAEEGILKYTFIIEDNQLKGINFVMPFIGTVKMEIQIKKR